MSNLHVVLYDIHEYFILNPNFLRASIEDSEQLDLDVRINKALRLHFKDIKEEEYHNTLIPALNRIGHDLRFAYGDGHTLIIYKKEEQVS
ncbi:hypothetical protein [Metabacillus sp. 84]|uniref:hypothetical protein n=1 Tax=unclassified Metabacillus TaxID=2675274 RepID=UPI003CF75EF8